MINTLKKFFAFCNEENRGLFYRSLVLGVIESLFAALKIPAIGLCLQALLGGTAGTSAILGCIGIMLVSILGQAGCKYFSTMQQTRGGFMTCANKRIEIAEHMRYMPMGYFNANSLGQITSVATNTMQNLENVATRVVMLVTKGLMTTAMIMLMILFFDVRIGVVCLIGLAVFALVNHVLQTAGAPHSEKKVTSDSQQVEKVLEYIQGIAEVKAYHLVGKMARQCELAIDENVKVNTDMEMAFIPWMTLQAFTADLISVAVAVVSLYFYCNGTMTLLNCVMMLICSFLITDGLKSAGAYSALLRTVDISVDKANAILQTETMDIEGKRLNPGNRTLEAKNISFAYGDKKVIDDVSLVIPEKTTTAIVGPSGSGKTTLCNLLSRFWDVDSGVITLGGIDIREYDMDSLMENFSFVFQNVILFQDTIANNINFGGRADSVGDALTGKSDWNTASAEDQRDAVPHGGDSLARSSDKCAASAEGPKKEASHGVSDLAGTQDGRTANIPAAVIEAAKKARCHDFIMELPDGYHTVIGEGGQTLSGGERQRISIARAMMKDAPIIILDEATANVDPENEKELMEAIEELTREKTVIMIAHRLKTVRGADQILVMDQGKIVQRGTHEALMAGGGLYRRLVADRERATGWKVDGSFCKP